MEKPGCSLTAVRNLLRATLVAAAGIALAGGALAAGTPSGTVIGNTAVLNYTIPGQPAASTSATAPDIVVAKVLSVVVTWQDAAPVTGASPEAARPLSFAVTNTGNGAETFRLSRNDAVTGDQFDPLPAATGSLWIESGAQPGFQASGPAADTAYVPGVNDLALLADATRTVYIVSDIPGSLATAATGRSTLTATATTPGAAAAVPGAALGIFGGVQVVAGAATQANATGSYLVAGVSLGVAKSVAAVRDPAGGTRVMPGSILTYRIVLTVTGIGVADAVALSDPLPAALTYLPGTLVVDGTPRTDAADADGANASANTVAASFGSVTAPATRVVQFQATVN